MKLGGIVLLGVFALLIAPGLSAMAQVPTRISVKRIIAQGDGVRHLGLTAISKASNADEIKDDDIDEKPPFSTETGLTSDVSSLNYVINGTTHGIAEWKAAGTLWREQHLRVIDCVQYSRMDCWATAAVGNITDPAHPAVSSSIEGNMLTIMKYEPKPPKRYPGEFFTLNATYNVSVSCPNPDGVREGTVLVAEIFSHLHGRVLSEVFVKHEGDGVFSVTGMHRLNEGDNGNFFGPPELIDDDLEEDDKGSMNWSKNTTNLLHKSEQFTVQTHAITYTTDEHGARIPLIAVADGGLHGGIDGIDPGPLNDATDAKIVAEIKVTFNIMDLNPN